MFICKYTKMIIIVKQINSSINKIGAVFYGKNAQNCIS